jgi:hypothetical protein
MKGDTIVSSTLQDTAPDIGSAHLPAVEGARATPRSVNAQREEVPLQLLHPFWCGLGPDCADVDDVDEQKALHRGNATSWQAGDVLFTLNRVRSDLLPRYFDDSPLYFDGPRRDAVDGRGGSAPAPGREHVELTITETPAGSADVPDLHVHSHDLEIRDLRVLIALFEQQLGWLESKFPGPAQRDYPRDDLTS